MEMGSANDRKAHEKTYGSFIDMLKWVVPLLAIITAVVVILISN
nr:MULTISPECIES: aa3-type cytochrome c oxidase subunit IV [Qipengyuania]